MKPGVLVQYQEEREMFAGKLQALQLDINAALLKQLGAMRRMTGHRGKGTCISAVQPYDDGAFTSA